MTPIALSPDDGRFNAFKALRLRDLPNDDRQRVIARCVRRGVSTAGWIKKAIEMQIDRDLAGICDGRPTKGFVYVFGPVDGDWVKVGWSCRPRKRLSEVRNSLALEQLAMFHVRGTLLPEIVEGKAHQLLADHARGFEQFSVLPGTAAEAISIAIKCAALL